MGYNYKTTDPQDTDFIYQAPVNYMQEAAQNVSNMDDQQIQQTDLLGNGIANVKYLPGNEAAVKSIQDNYNKQINDITQQVSDDPTNFQKRMPLIRNLTRDITNNLTNGELSYYQQGANALSEFDKNNHQKVVGVNGKPGTVTPEAYQTARAAYLADYQKRIEANGGQAYNPQTKVGIPFAPEDLIDTPNINKAISDATDKIKANSTDWKKDSITGNWIFTNQNKNETVEQARVAQVARDAVVGSPEITAYLKQGNKLGYLKGTYDANGNFIEPYSTDSTGKLTWNPNSMLAAPIRSAVGRDAYSKADKEESAKDNPYGLKGYSSALELGNQQKMAVLNNQLSDASKVNAENLAQKHKEDLAVWHTALTNGVSVQSVLDKLAGGASATKITASPDGVTTISPFAGDGQLTSDKMNKALIPNVQANMAQALADSKNTNLTENQRALAQQKYTEQKGLYDQYQQWGTLAHDDAVQKLTGQYSSKDLTGYTNYMNNVNGMKDNLNKTATALSNQVKALTNPQYMQDMIDSGASGEQPYTDPQRAKVAIQHLQVISDQIQKYNDIDEKLKKNTDSWYKSNSNQTNIPLKGVGLSAPNKQTIYDALKSNPEVEIHDTNTDNTSSTKHIQDMIKDIVAKGGNLSDYLDVKTINSPAPGVGTTVTIHLKDAGIKAAKPFMSLDNRDLSKDMLLTLPSSVLNTVGTNMKTNGSSDNEKQIGDIITNKSKSDALEALKNRIMDKDAMGNDQPIGSFSHYDPESKQMVNIESIPNFRNGEQQADSYTFYIKDSQGNRHLFTDPQYDTKTGKWLDRNPTGEYANEEAAIDKLFPNTVPQK